MFTPAQVDQLPNGLTTVVIDRPGTHQVLITLMVRVGSRFEPADRIGVTHFLEHMLFRGNAAYPDAPKLNVAFEAVGGSANANTGVESTEFYFTCHPERVDAGLALLSHLMRTPTFPDVDKERQIILEEMLYDYNERGELVDLPAIMARMLWPSHPLGQSITGTPETLETLNVEHLREHLRDYVYPANCVLAVCGNVRAETVFRSVREHLGDWTSSRTTPRKPLPLNGNGNGNGHHGPIVKTVNDADNQFHVQLSFSAPGYGTPTEVPLMVLTRVLDDGPNSLLQRIVREDRALVYGISAGYTGYQDAGQFDIATSVRADRLPTLLDTLTEVVQGLRDNGPSTADLEGARLRHRYDLEFGRDSLYAWVDRYAWPLMYAKVRTEADEMDAFAAVTAEQIRALAGELLTKDRMHLAVVGPVDGKTEDVLWNAVRRW